MLVSSVYMLKWVLPLAQIVLSKGHLHWLIRTISMFQSNSSAKLAIARVDIVAERTELVCSPPHNRTPLKVGKTWTTAIADEPWLLPFSSVPVKFGPVWPH